MPRQTPLMTTDHASDLAILIIRVSAIGDVLMASPVAQVLKERYPHARISWIVEPLSAPLVYANPYVDDVIIIDIPSIVRSWRKKHFRETLRLIRQYIRILRERHFDITIDCQGLLKSGLIGWYSSAKHRIGPLPGAEGSQVFINAPTRWPAHPTRLAEKYLAMLNPLGIPVTPRRLVLEVPDAEQDAARAFLAEHGLHDERYVACCVSSSRPWKDWEWSRWGELADVLWERESLRTVLIGGPEKRTQAEQLCENRTSQPISAVGQLSILQSAAVVQGAVGVVGVDTGLTYAGMTRELPTIALYGSTDATWLVDEPNTVICYHKMPCSPCRRHPTCTHYDCMRAITVEEVVTALVEQLKLRQTI